MLTASHLISHLSLAGATTLGNGCIWILRFCTKEKPINGAEEVMNISGHVKCAYTRVRPPIGREKGSLFIFELLSSALWTERKAVSLGVTGVVESCPEPGC